MSKVANLIFTHIYEIKTRTHTNGEIVIRNTIANSLLFFFKRKAIVPNELIMKLNTFK